MKAWAIPLSMSLLVLSASSASASSLWIGSGSATVTNEFGTMSGCTLVFVVRGADSGWEIPTFQANCNLQALGAAPGYGCAGGCAFLPPESGSPATGFEWTWTNDFGTHTLKTSAFGAATTFDLVRDDGTAIHGIADVIAA